MSIRSTRHIGQGKRESRIVMRVTKAEAAELRDRAKSRKCSISSYIRATIGQEPIEKPRPASLPELRAAAAISRIGSALGYLLRLAEQQKISSTEVAAIVAETRAVIWDLVMELREPR